MMAAVSSLPLFPEQASTIGAGVDHLYFFLLSLSAFFATLIFVLVFFFAIKYRRRPGHMKAEQIASSLPLEVLWTFIPLVLMLVVFFWGAGLYFFHARPPANASVVYVVGKQWMWKLQHPEGRREINELHVPVGRPIKLVMTTEDVIHSFYVPAFRIKQDVVPGRYTSEWFEATKPGRYHLFCAQYCGTNHAQMAGWVYVMEPADYENWLSGGASPESMPAAGERLFQQFGCATCHNPRGTGRGPMLEGVFDTKVHLQGGATVTADEAYLRESILNPGAKIVAGYTNIMPTFQGQIGEEGLLQIISYLKTLKRGKQP
ncbi:MAG: cytochrome c oxidase subunit II [Acidobacteria bacterium]|nr:cytochrome c oxidase subunit II [Acidobacteriota bacterium]